MKGSTVLSESQVSTFRTMMQPAAAPEIPETVINFPEPAGTPNWVWFVIALAAILIIVVIVLIVRIRRV
jgi:bacteriorhodopsin